jgi:DNA-binding CsgD family transcriptional regulator
MLRQRGDFMLHGDCQSVLEARNADEFLGVVLRFARRLGFDFATAMTVFDRPSGQYQFVPLDNMPAGFRAICSDPGVGRRDPVMQFCRRNGLPIVWGQSTYLQGGAMDLWEQQAPFGFCAGIAVALHLPQGRHFMVGVDRDQPLPKNPNEVARMTAELSMFTAHSQDTALRLFDTPEPPSHRPLSKRELEVLRWTLDGHTALQVGDRLGITERTVHMHSRHATKKLGCASKHQAVLKALRLGLVG